jgi:hypothetical protein
VKDALLNRLSDAVIQDEHKEFIHVHVRDVTMLWSTMFQVMENIRTEFSKLEDYSISETSLEQVFISFAKQQKSSEQKGEKKEEKEKDDIEDDNVHHRKLVRHLSSISRTSEDYSKLK